MGLTTQVTRICAPTTLNMREPYAIIPIDPSFRKTGSVSESPSGTQPRIMLKNEPVVAFGTRLWQEAWQTSGERWQREKRTVALCPTLMQASYGVVHASSKVNSRQTLGPRLTMVCVYCETIAYSSLMLMTPTSSARISPQKARLFASIRGRSTRSHSYRYRTVRSNSPKSRTGQPQFPWATDTYCH